MFKTTRISKIKEIILDRGQINVNTLSSLLNVSVVTIRSDLEELEREGFIQRTHGGAVLNEDYLRQQSVKEDMQGGVFDYSKDKEMIGQIAAELIQDSEWIFIGQGSTCYYMARALQNKQNLNLLTNNLYVAGALSQNISATVMFTSGQLVHNRMYIAGDMLLQPFQNFHISKAFLSVSGIDFQNGYTVSDWQEYSVFNKIRDRAGELIILADHSKFDKPGPIGIGDLKSAGAIITNENISERYKTYFFENGVKIYTSYLIKNSEVKGSTR
jgi:DeoR/GlpR family transcriptional regulator of sugar metabolism